MKLYSFNFYYNKPASRLARSTKLSIKYKKQLLVVDAIECDVPIKSTNRKTQPHCIMVGKCASISIIQCVLGNLIAIIK